MRTGYNHTRAALNTALGLLIILIIAAVCITWVAVEIVVGVTMLQLGSPFLGWAMLAIAASNVVFGLILIGRAIS